MAKNKFSPDRQTVVKRYVWAAIFCVGAGLAALYVAECINHHVVISHFRLQILRLLGVIPGAIGVYGPVGWEIQTADGNTPPERLDRRLSKGLMAFGYIVAILTMGLTEG